MPDVTGLNYCFVSPQYIFSNVSGIIETFFWKMWDETLCLACSSSVLFWVDAACLLDVSLMAGEILVGRALLDSQSFKNSFVTFSRLIGISQWICFSLLQLLFHIGPGRRGYFSLNKWNNHLKTVFHIFSGYLCLILECDL